MTFEAKGVIVNYESLHEFIVDKEASQFAEDYVSFRNQRLQPQVEERRLAFAKLENEHK